LGIANFKWEVQTGKLEGNFRLPDPNASQQQVIAIVPAPGGPPNRFYLLLSDDHLLLEDDPNFLAPILVPKGTVSKQPCDRARVEPKRAGNRRP
jgi:hypothetical protein